MRKVLVSLGCGPHAELLAISGETFRAFADRHSYDVDLRLDPPVHGRGAPWEKIRIVQELAAAYDFVLWVDADAAFVDISMDIAQCLGRRDLMALCGHRTPEGAVIPNTGIWVLRSSRRTDRFLEDVWNATEFLDHKWWENSAVIDRLGFEVGPPCVVRKLTPMGRRTKILGTEWNSIAADPSPHPRIVHFPAMSHDERVAGLTRAAEVLRASR